MQVRCPFNPNHTIRVLDSQCPICDRAITLRELFKCYKRRLQWSVLLECPKCECVSPLGAEECGRCRTPVTVTRFLAFAFRAFWSACLTEAQGVSVNTIRTFQRFYLAASLILLWGSVSVVATAQIESL